MTLIYDLCFKKLMQLVMVTESLIIGIKIFDQLRQV